jgi:DNA polymerase III alpha subunit
VRVPLHFPAAPPHPKSWWAVPPPSATAPWQSPTSARLAGVVKAHMAAKEAGLRLLLGSQMTVTPEDGSAPFDLLILAMNRNGYGNLSELITVARRSAEKGTYLVRPRDIAAPPGTWPRCVACPTAS